MCHSCVKLHPVNADWLEELERKKLNLILLKNKDFHGSTNLQNQTWSR